jgi:hypothetical protein
LSNPNDNVFQGQQKLGAQILEVLVQLAKNADQLEDNQTHVARFDALQSLLPHEHREDFNADMDRCIHMSSVHEFWLSDEVVATNILPHYANFLSSMIIGNLINYRPHGCPVLLKIEVDAVKLATATIQWAYSLVGVDDVTLPG